MPEIVSLPSRQADASWKENKNAFYLFWHFLFVCFQWFVLFLRKEQPLPWVKLFESERPRCRRREGPREETEMGTGTGTGTGTRMG